MEAQVVMKPELPTMPEILLTLQSYPFYLKDSCLFIMLVLGGPLDPFRRNVPKT